MQLKVEARFNRLGDHLIGLSVLELRDSRDGMSFAKEIATT